MYLSCDFRRQYKILLEFLLERILVLIKVKSGISPTLREDWKTVFPSG